MARSRDDDEDGDPLPPEEQRLSGRRKQKAYPKKRLAIEAHRSLPFPEWAKRFLKIRNKAGKLEPFVLNGVQLDLDAEIEAQLAERGYALVQVLKARKMGVSTYFQGKEVRAVLEKEGWNAGVMAHDDTGCDMVFERAKTFVENLPPEMRRTIRKNNKKEVAFAAPHSSFLRVNVAKGRGVWGSGGDIHMVHFSERAKWSLVRGESVAQGQATAIYGAMPEVPGIIVVDESTAYGKNAFYDSWCDAEPDEEKGTRWGKNDFVRKFYPWFIFPEYRIAGKKPEDFFAKPEWEKDEPHLRHLGCDDEQLAWRRWRIANKCSADLDTFRQEFPSYALEAFLATGRPVFTASDVNERLSVLERREQKTPTSRWAFNANGEPFEARGGELRLFSRSSWERIDLTKPERYVITADPAGSGTNSPDEMKGDPACAYVWDRAVNEQIAEWHGWCQPHEFAMMLIWLGALYGKPMIVCEAGAWGGHVNSVLREQEYERLYYRDRIGEQLQTTPTNYGQYGWVTSAKSKPQMIDALRQLWTTRAIIVNSADCCKEHLTFVKNGVKREAQSGCHDDRVMACAIFAMWSMEHPYEEQTQVYKATPLTCGMVMEEMLARADNKGRRALHLW